MLQLGCLLLCETHAGNVEPVMAGIAADHHLSIIGFSTQAVHASIALAFVAIIIIVVVIIIFSISLLCVSFRALLALGGS